MAIEEIQMRFHMFFILILGVAVSTSCSHIEVPKDIPQIDLNAVPRFARQGSFQFTNPYKTQDLRLMYSAGFHKYYIDMSVWNTFVIEKLSMELQKRGCVPSADPSRTIEVRLVSVQGNQGFFKTSATVSLDLSCGDFRRTYVQGNSSGLSLGRSLGGAVAKIIMAILKDPSFIALIGG
jgi:hypothetical protein